MRMLGKSRENTVSSWSKGDQVPSWMKAGIKVHHRHGRKSPDEMEGGAKPERHPGEKAEDCCASLEWKRYCCNTATGTVSMCNRKHIGKKDRTASSSSKKEESRIQMIW